MDKVTPVSIKNDRVLPDICAVTLGSSVTISMVWLGQGSLGSVSLWPPGPEALRDSPVERELGGLTASERKRRVVIPAVSCLSCQFGQGPGNRQGTGQFFSQ